MIETTPATRRAVGRGSLKDQSADPSTGKTFKFLGSVKMQATVPRRKAAAAVEEKREEEERRLRLARQQEESATIASLMANMQDLEMRMCDQPTWAKEYVVATRAIQKWYRLLLDRRAEEGMHKLIDLIKADQAQQAIDDAVEEDNAPVRSVIAEYIKQDHAAVTA